MDKIKIIFVNHSLICGGAEQALFDLISLLDKEKFESAVFVQNPGGEWDKKFQEAGIPVIYDYSCRQPTLNPVVKFKNIVKKIRTYLAYKNDGAGLLDVCLPYQPDVVVSYNVWVNEEMVFSKGASTVKYIHGDPDTNMDYRKEAINRKAALSRFDKVVCVADVACKAFQRISGIVDSVEMHYNPLNSQNVRLMAGMAIDLPCNCPLICAVGRLAPEKGFERLIIIHKHLLEQGIYHKLVIVGDGPDRDFLRRLVYATDTQDTVILAGYQINPYPYMKNSRFLVNSSFTEGLPVIAMEALCLGVPIVTPIPSVAEIFGQENCGLITENNNASLEAGIKRMLVDEAFYKQIKEGAVRRSTFFDGKRMVKEVEDMFIKLAAETKE